MNDPQMSAMPIAAQPFIPLETGFQTLLYLRALLVAGALLGAAALAALILSDMIPPALILIPAALAALVALILWPRRAYKSWGYIYHPDYLRVKSGALFFSDSLVPISRVQHIDVTQGPLERACHVATLVLYNAGTATHALALPGVSLEVAELLRDDIRSKIEQALM